MEGSEEKVFTSPNPIIFRDYYSFKVFLML